ncbi:hypothetical protein MMC13_002352 [Lambiella insularis]|nr:hypothetical protein [Lambiella insularis]
MLVEAMIDVPGASHPTILSESIMSALTSARPSRPSSSASEARPLSPIPETPSEILKRTLSVHPIIPTSSIFAERLNRTEAQAAEKRPDYRIIGIGSCGTVFEVPGTAFALKKGEDAAAIWKDFLLTNRVYNAIADTRDVLQDAFPGRTLPRAPQCAAFLRPASEVLKANLDRFPKSHREAGAVFQVDRILPLPQQTREALIERYFDDSEGTREEAKSDADNGDCLVRIYLGENEEDAVFYDSLRNFPLRLNMIEELDLDTAALATEMAIALAVIHWQAQVDAMDSEFVLGSAATTLPERRRAFTTANSSENLPPEEHVYCLDFTRRSTHLWVLDFDKANTIELTDNDVKKKLVPAFLGNDPYYPRPDVDEDLWQTFSEAYLKASRLILRARKLEGTVLELPEQFLENVAQVIKAQEGWDPEAQIVFAE